MKIGVSSHFEKRVKRLSAEEKTALDEKTEWFAANMRDPRLKVHALTGRLKGYFSFSITQKRRVKFRIVSEDEVILVDVGSHDEVYR